VSTAPPRVLGLLSTSAPAAPKAEVARAQALLEVQRTALAAHDIDGLMRTFTATPFVLLPGATSVAADAPSAARLLRATFARDEVSAAAGASFSSVKIVGIGHGAVVSARLTVEWTGGDAPTTYRVTELLVANPDDGSLRVFAAALTMPVTAKAAVAHLADADFRPVPMPGASEGARIATLLTSPPRMAKALFKDPGVTVFGTEVAEQAFGLAPARALLGRWKSIKLTVDGGVSHGTIEESGLTWLAANVNLASGKRSLPFRVVVFARDNPEDGSFEVLAVHFSSAAYPGE